MHQTAFETFRKNELFFEDVVTADYDSYEKAKIDKDGALVLVGVMNLDKGDLKYNLHFVQNDNAWKVLFINVDVSGKKQNCPYGVRQIFVGCTRVGGSAHPFS